MADPPLTPGNPLDYAAPDPPKRGRRRLTWLAVLTAAAHFLLTHLIWLAAAEPYSSGLFDRWFVPHLIYPLALADNAGWLDHVPDPVLIILVPLNSLLYGCVLTALALLIARSQRLLIITAAATLAYPLLFAVVLYGEWLIAWVALGHPPRPSQDDPKDIPGAIVTHSATYLALLAIPWAACAAITLNLAHTLFARPSTNRTITRLALLLSLWTALATILIHDPGHVLYWWFD